MPRINGFGRRYWNSAPQVNKTDWNRVHQDINELLYSNKKTRILGLHIYVPLLEVQLKMRRAYKAILVSVKLMQCNEIF